MTEPSAPRKRPEFSQDPRNLSEFWQDLPMLKHYPVIAGALAGLLLRLVFSGERLGLVRDGWCVHLRRPAHRRHADCLPR